MKHDENADIEINLFIEAVYQKYGYDFRDYSQSHMKRRILHRAAIEEFKNISEMTHRVLYNPEFFKTILEDLSIKVTEMYRDPSFFKTFKNEVVPVLKTYPFIKIWHAGCSTGEEVYSMAIILKEAGIYDRVQIYATDFNGKAVEKAREGIFPISAVKKYTSNYQQAGGEVSLSDYYIAKYDSVIMDSALKERIIFAEHNLVTDGVFSEMHVILCRNVLIYFNSKLQNKVINLFSNSLINGCFLCLGSKESLRFLENNDFENFDEREKIYRKKLI